MQRIVRQVGYLQDLNCHNKQMTHNHLHYSLYKISVSASQRTQPLSITNNYQVLLFLKIKAHSFSIHLQYVSTMWTHVQVVRVLVFGLWKAKRDYKEPAMNHSNQVYSHTHIHTHTHTHTLLLPKHTLIIYPTYIYIYYLVYFVWGVYSKMLYIYNFPLASRICHHSHFPLLPTLYIFHVIQQGCHCKNYDFEW
jgi:hypothetical protein